jgi:uncharacterized protein YkwD
LQAINKIANGKAGASRPPGNPLRSVLHRSLIPATLLITTLLLFPAFGFAASPHKSSNGTASSYIVSSLTPYAANSALRLELPLLSYTDQPLQGAFLQTYQKYGLSLIGYPLSPELKEGTTTVQYFERVKMEYHPEFASQGAEVLFTRLGADISAGSPFGKVKPFSPSRFKSYFAATGHSLADPFFSFWRSNGGISLFGYPISEPLRQDGMLVQWFERARMEYHPELASKGQVIQLTHLGRIALSRAHTQIAPPQLASPPPPSAVNGMESNLLAGINAQRAAAGAPPVSLAPELADFAHWRSADMAAHNFFAHSTSAGRGSLDALRDRGINYTLAGEILEKNNFDDAETVGAAVNDFLNSPAHRAIMLDGRYTQVGVGFAVGGDGMHYFTAVFIRK